MRKTNNSQLQTRYIPFTDSETKVESRGDARILRGYAAKFDSVSGDFLERTIGIRETISRGFFGPAIGKPNRIFGLFNHDDNVILGERNAGTMILDEDTRGLSFEITLSDSQLVRDMVLIPMQRGEITGCSFRAFVNPDFVKYERKTDVYRLMPGGCEMLVDVGPVTYQAYDGTEVEARSAMYERMRKPERHGKNKDFLEYELYKFKLGTGV